MIIDDDINLMHTLFALEDIYGFKIDMLSDEICIRLDKNRGMEYIKLLESFNTWYREAKKFRDGEISKEDYDHWRYNYPDDEIERTMSAIRGDNK